MKTNLCKPIGQLTPALCLLFALLAAPACARAATLTVTNTADSGPGTLRSALASAANGDTIDFGLPTPATILLTSGELLVSKSVNILGPGASNLAVNGNAATRVFHIAQSRIVTIASLSVTNGNGTNSFPSEGGGIFNEHATLTVSNCTINGNRGSGIYNDGNDLYGFGAATLTVLNSTLHGNSSVGGYGGGIFNHADAEGSATVDILNSTLSGNTSTVGGGLASVAFNSFGPGHVTMRIINCTISSNSSVGSGAGIFSGGVVSVADSASFQVFNCTLNGNSGLDATIVNHLSKLQIGGTILNPGSPGTSISRNSEVIDLGYNLSKDDGGVYYGGILTNSTDLLNTDPMLGPLQDNGGPTFTHAPLPGSPAIDRGTNFSASATDQRGLPRTLNLAGIPNAAGGDGTDIGAVEFQDTSLRLINLGVVSNQFGFNLIGPFTNVVVEASTTLTNWTPLTTNALGDAALRFNDPTPPSLPQRIYRARVQ